MANNIITAAFSSSTITYTKPAYQYDYGMILKFSGIELPQAYEVHFSNTEFCGESISQIGDETGVTIPDEMFLSGNPIYAWTYLHTGEDDGETVYKTVISINKRAQPSDIEPTPVQQDVITQAIAALDVAVEQTAQDVLDATAAKDAAELAQGKAEDAQEAAEIAQGKAEDAQEAAETAQGKAEDAQQAAEAAAGSVLGLTADATVDANVGTPSVSVSVTTESDHKNMSFAFHNLKGVQGDTGVGISSVVLNADYTLTINLTNGTSYTTSSIRGEVGATPNLTIGTVTTLPEGSQATATITGTDEEPVLNLGIPVGDTGVGIASVEKTGTSGLVDTYTITYTDGTTSTFEVTNGADGEVSEEELIEKLADKADIITSSASGEIVTIADGAKNLPVVDLSVSLLPVQDLHGQSAPYPPGGGVNKADLTGAYAYNDGTYGMYVTVDEQNETIQLSGTWSNSNPVGTWRFLVVPNITNGLGLKGFEITSGDHVDNFYWDGETKRLVCVIKNMTQGTAYTIKFKLVAYEGSTAPSAWSPYSNVCPISGWTGMEVYQSKKNLLDDAYRSVFSNSILYYTNDGLLLAKGTYTLSISETVNGIYCNELDGTSIFIKYNASSLTFTLQEQKIVYFDFYKNGGIGQSDQCQLEVGSVATSFETHVGTAYPISWQSSAGTVYGCNIDVTNGGLIVDTAIRIYDGVNNKFNLISDSGAYKFITDTTFSANGYSTTATNNPPTLWCNMYKPVGLASLGNTYISGGYFRVCADPSFADVASFNAYLQTNNLVYVYKITQPIEYTLSENQIATLLGVNNFWSNGNGQIDLEYRCDTKLYIEQLTKPTEDDMIANANITSGSFFMVGNRLFLSTTAIAQGEQIVVGTNCSELSLADGLNLLNS